MCNAPSSAPVSMRADVPLHKHISAAMKITRGFELRGSQRAGVSSKITDLWGSLIHQNGQWLINKSHLRTLSKLSRYKPHSLIDLFTETQHFPLDQACVCVCVTHMDL